jgi:hypothetical protein
MYVCMYVCMYIVVAAVGLSHQHVARAPLQVRLCVVLSHGFPSAATAHRADAAAAVVGGNGRVRVTVPDHARRRGSAVLIDGWNVRTMQDAEDLLF